MLARCCSKEQIQSYCYQVCSTQPPGSVVRVPKRFYRMGDAGFALFEGIYRYKFSKLVSIHFLKECIERI